MSFYTYILTAHVMHDSERAAGRHEVVGVNLPGTEYEFRGFLGLDPASSSELAF